jgi:hypothetical protein
MCGSGETGNSIPPFSAIRRAELLTIFVRKKGEVGVRSYRERGRRRCRVPRLLRWVTGGWPGLARRRMTPDGRSRAVLALSRRERGGALLPSSHMVRQASFSVRNASCIAWEVRATMTSTTKVRQKIPKVITIMTKTASARASIGCCPCLGR